MAVGALVPDRAVVFSGIDRKEGVMIWELRRFPPGIDCVAFRTVCRQGKGNMAGIGGRSVVGLVAGIAILRRVGVITVHMAFVAFNVGVAKSKWKCRMIESSRFPSGVGGMALITDCRELQ